MTRDEAIALAKRHAWQRTNDHDYLAGSGAHDWMPHEWVIDAVMAAATQAPEVAHERTPHAFACRKTIESGKTCEQWCGNQHSCISTLTYKQTLLQEAYERGHHDALWAVENELVRESRSTSPHRRLMAEQLFHTFSKIKPKAFDFAPTAEADSHVPVQGNGHG